MTQQQQRVIKTNEENEHHGNNAVVTSKYTWFNILPKAIWNQFRRLSNFYFLIVAVISFIPNISPSSPLTTTLPLAVVIGFGLARDVYEDFLRKKSDAKSNGQPVMIQKRRGASGKRNAKYKPGKRNGLKVDGDNYAEVIRRDSVIPEQHSVIRCMDIIVGDIILIANNMHIPADIILLRSENNEKNECFVSTANLDGESNLKRKHVPISNVDKDDIEIVMSKPTPSLYDIQGTIQSKAHKASISERNILLRGSVLRNSKYIHGIVVYTGKDTKLSQNMKQPPSKLGGIEKTMNHLVIFLFILLLVLTVITSLLAGLWQNHAGLAQWYMGDNKLLSGSVVGSRSFGTFIILYHTFVPVSLFVTLEFVRLAQGFFITVDKEMGLDVDVKANNLNDSLGYVHHIFSDKTGTLTQNIMRFISCYIPYDEDEDDEVEDDMGMFYKVDDDFGQGVRNDVGLSKVGTLALAMALCHDVMPADNDNDQSDFSAIEYQGESPDEVALVCAARDAGMILTDRQQNQLEIQHASVSSSTTTTYEILGMIPFSSQRKRMSIMISTDEKIRIICKGADSVIIPLLKSSRSREQAKKQSDILSRQGLRTLVYGSCLIDSAFVERLKDAERHMGDRQQAVDDIAAEIETGFDLVGVTGVEDKLQDEVGETIEKLRSAGIIVWVLTGDKLETAENIGYSCNLLKESMNVCAMEGLNVIHTIRDTLRQFYVNNNDNNNALIIDGQTLATIIQCDGDGKDDSGEDEEVKGPSIQKEFVKLALRCETVICARITPLQKAEIIKLVETFTSPNLITLAIGDGGNDVSMIQQASIGIGIKGKEGTQASRASDYSISQFKYLWRLLSVHGRFSYIRTTGTIHLSLYKNVFFSTTQFLFQFFNFASGTTFHNQWIVTSWNAIITLLPPFFYGIYERDLEARTCCNIPNVYNRYTGRRFGIRSVIEFTLGYSVWHANVLFWLTYFNFGHFSQITFTNGLDSGFFLTGFVVSCLAVCIALMKFVISSHVLNAVVISGILVSFTLLWVLAYIFPLVAHELALEGILTMLFKSLSFLLLWPVVFVLAFLPDFVIRLWNSNRRGDNMNVIEGLQILESKGLL